MQRQRRVCRPARKSESISIPEDLRDIVYGQVVDLCYVDDPLIAQIISWAALPHMATIVTKDSRLRMDARFKNRETIQYLELNETRYHNQIDCR
jgi:hypothetical protein